MTMATRQSHTCLRLLSVKPAVWGLSARPGTGEATPGLHPQPTREDGALQGQRFPGPEGHVVLKPSKQEEAEGRLAEWILFQQSARHVRVLERCPGLCCSV